MLNMAFSMMSARQKQKFKETTEIDMAYGVAGLGRFRVNIFQQRGNVGLVLRVIPTKIRALDELYLPKIVEQICDMPAAWCWSRESPVPANQRRWRPWWIASTRRAQNTSSPSKTRSNSCIATRKATSTSAKSKWIRHLRAALRARLRQDPDVILVGEMRDLETIGTALHAAETGHMVFSTLHTLDAVETINRIISIFPPPEQKQIRLQLAAVLRAVVSQRLVRALRCRRPRAGS